MYTPAQCSVRRHVWRELWIDRIVKRFHEPQPLQRRLADLGWSAQVQTTPEFFIYGHATPAQ